MLQACSRILLTGQQPCRHSLCQIRSLGAIHQSKVDHDRLAVGGVMAQRKALDSASLARLATQDSHLRMQMYMCFTSQS